MNCCLRGFDGGGHAVGVVVLIPEKNPQTFGGTHNPFREMRMCRQADSPETDDQMDALECEGNRLDITCLTLPDPQ